MDIDDSSSQRPKFSPLWLSLNPPISARLSASQAESGADSRSQVVGLPGWREVAPGEGMRSGEAGEIGGFRLRFRAICDLFLPGLSAPAMPGVAAPEQAVAQALDAETVDGRRRVGGPGRVRTFSQF